MKVRLGSIQIDPSELPFVTLAVVVLCLAVSLALRPGVSSEDDPETLLAGAVDYWSRHAYLEAEPEILLAVGHDRTLEERRARIVELRDESYRRWPSDPSLRREQQDELDTLSDAALAVYGLTAAPPPAAFVPATPRLRGLFTHAFWQPNALLLVLQLLAILALGSALERTYGWMRMAALSALAVPFAAGFYLAMAPAARTPLMGSASLTAAWLGAALLTLWASGWRPLPGGRGVRVPAWTLALVWLAPACLELAAGGLGAIAYQAPVGALAFGAVAGLVQRAGGAAVLNAGGADDSRPKLERARESQARGDAPRAFALLQGAVRESPGDRETVLAFWDAALACGRSDAGCPPLLSLIRGWVEGNELALAARYWMQVTHVMPSARLDAATLIGLAPTLAVMNQPDAARDALAKSVAPRTRGLTGPLLLRAAQLADELGDAELALKAGRLGLDHPDLEGPARVVLRQLVADLVPRVGESGAPTASASADDEEASSAVVPRFQSAKVIEGVPAQFRESSLAIRLLDERAFQVEYERVQAIASAGVLGLGDGPVVIIDLLLNWTDIDDEVLQVIRLRGDRFDPRTITGDGVRRAEAYRVFLRRLYAVTRAQPLPDERAASGGQMRVFESIEAYQTKVLDVAD